MEQPTGNIFYDTFINFVKKTNKKYNTYVENYLNQARAKLSDEKGKAIWALLMPTIFGYIVDHNRFNNYSKIDMKMKKYKSLLIQVNSSFKPSNSTYSIENKSVMVQLLHYIYSLHENKELRNYLSGQYPLRLTVNIMTITTFINIENRASFTEQMIKLFFTIHAQILHIVETSGNIEYYEGSSDIGDIIPSMTFSFAKMNRIKGQFLPKKLRIPSIISRAVVNPNNDDIYCMMYCIIISKFFLAKEIIDGKLKAKVAQTITLNKMENFPLIKEKFNHYFKEFEPIYKTTDICSEENIIKLEKIFDVNINIYTYLDNTTDDIDVYYRSSFKNATNNHVVRLLFIPYSVCEKSAKNYNVDEYKLNSKKKDDFLMDLDKKSFFTSNKGHFTVMSENSSLLNKIQVTDKYHTCSFCDLPFRSLKTLQNHTEQCKLIKQKETNNERIVNYKPNPEGKFKSFNNYASLSKQPFIIYCDTETNTESNHKLFSYMLFCKHSYNSDLDRTIIRCAESEDEIGDKMCYKFMNDLTNLRIHVANNVNVYKEMDRKERDDFIAKNPQPKCCQWCLKSEKVEVKDGKEISKPIELMVHHDHNIEKNNIIGWLCNSCNQKESMNNKSVSIVFHNLAYDLLVLIKSLTFDSFTYKNLTVKVENHFELIAQTSMKYQTLTIESTYGEFFNQRGDKLYTKYLPAVKFIDSYAFVPSSLAKIISDLQEGVSDDEKYQAFKNTKKYIEFKYPKIATKLFNYSTTKGSIAYDYTTIESMKSKTNLPIQCYQNRLDISKDYLEELKGDKRRHNKLFEYNLQQTKELIQDYKRSNDIFDLLKENFKEKMTYKEYFLFYLELDIMLLADFFEYFREKMIDSHKIDPAHYIGLPSFSQQAMLLRNRDTKLHLIGNDVNLSKFISSELRGGLSLIMQKISENFDQCLFKYISAIDINNLYGWAMTQKIANKYCGELRFKEWNEEKLSYSFDGDFAYFLHVDYTVPIEIHDKLAKLPPLVSKKVIKQKDLSEEQLATNKVIKANYKSEKLCATLEDGKDMLINYDNFLFYQELGYKFTVKRIFKFEKEYIFKEYIDFNTSLRQKAINELEKNLYKLLNNIIYGKSLQRNDLNTEGELLSNDKIIQKRLLSPLLKSVDIIDDDTLVFTNSYKANCKFDTAIQNGFHILELSKLHIYRMLYKDIIPFCDKNKVEIKLLLTDTDSLYVEYNFENSSFKSYPEYMRALQNETKILDMHTFKDCTPEEKKNKKKVGLFLDEYGEDKEIIALVGLCAKSYCYVIKHKGTSADKKKGITYYNKEELVVKGKGVRNSYLSALYDFDDYRATANNEGKLEKVKFNNICKKNFTNIITEVEKLTISSFDDKFYHYKDENNQLKSLPYGHYKIKDLQRKND